MSTVESRKLEEQLKGLYDDLEILRIKLTEQDNIVESINQTYKKIHNFKSSLYLMDQNESLKLTYMLEQHFEKLCTGELLLSEKGLNLIIDSFDWIKADLGLINETGTDRESLVLRLREIQNSKSEQTGKSQSLSLTSDEKALLRDARNGNLNIFLVEYPLDPGIKREEYRDLDLFQKINDIGMIAVKTPEFVNLARERNQVLLKVIFVTDRKQKELKDPLIAGAVPFDEDLYLSQRDYKILIIEDNPVAQILQKSIMSDFGVCDTVDNGESGLELINLALEEKSPYHIILLDLVMPGMGGAEVLKKIRELEGKFNIKGLDRSKVIVSTTTTESAVLMDLFRAEADAYIFKPLTREKITKEMKNLKLI